MDGAGPVSGRADAQAAADVEQHHAEMAGVLGLKVEALVCAAAAGNPTVARAALEDLTGWCVRELVPHAAAEERTLYPAAHAIPEGRLLVEGLMADHRVIADLVTQLSQTTEGVRGAAAARAVQTLFETHLRKESELLLPLLSAASYASLADLLHGMRELLVAPAVVETEPAGS